MKADSAHSYWNREWQKAGAESLWARPEPWVMEEAARLAPASRVLRPGGTFFATMLSARHLPVECARASGREISRNTWVFDGPGDKSHPHYFCTAANLVGLLWWFEVLTLFDRPHEKPGSWHWHLLAERL